MHSYNKLILAVTKLLIVLSALKAAPVFAADVDPAAYSLSQLLAKAESNFPLFKAKQAEIASAGMAINLIQATTEPHFNLTFQYNLATYNNVTGLFNPQGLMPVSGPPSTQDKYLPVPGKAAGLLMNWSPISFGQVEAQTGFAAKQVQQKERDQQNALFQHKINLIATYLNVWLAQEKTQLQQLNQARFDANAALLHVLVVKGIRPEVEESQLLTEQSKARLELLNSQKELETQKWMLAELVASSDLLPLVESQVLSHVPDFKMKGVSYLHPTLALQQASLESDKAKLAVIASSLWPTLNLWGTLSVRGSSVEANGDLDLIDGLFPHTLNYGVGFNISVPVFNEWEVDLQTRQQDLLVQASEARLHLAQLELAHQQELISVELRHHLLVAKEAAQQLELAEVTFRAMQTRYGTGLAPLADLLQTQYLLNKAETDLKGAYVQLWRTFLAQSALQGNLEPVQIQLEQWEVPVI